MKDISAQSVERGLDALSRKRALTDAESALLETAIAAANNGHSIRIRKRDAARIGVKRDMGSYAR